MTPPSSPRAGRSTVSAAGEPTPAEINIAKRWATLDIPNPYRPDTVAWVAFEQGQLAALDAIEAEAAESRPSVTERPDLPHAAIKRAVEWVEENIAPKRCDNEGVSDCWRCTTVALARWLARAAASPAGPEAVPQGEREGLLRLALETITVEKDGRRMYRTRDGVPMEMPAKFDRIVRAALASPAHPDEEPRP
jgi:hypothetical protein